MYEIEGLQETALFASWYAKQPKRPGTLHRQRMLEMFAAGYNGEYIRSVRRLGDAGRAYRAGQAANAAERLS